jgi:zinc transporter ZupT
MDEAYKAGGFDAASLGLLLGALVFFAADRAVNKAGGRHRKRSQGQQEGNSGAAITAASALFGYLFLSGVSEDVIAAIQSFAAGAILTMLAGTMMPEAYQEGGEMVGLVTTVGFLLAFILTHLE